MSTEMTFGRRLLLSVDAKNYGGSDDRRQHTMQSDLLAVLDRAAIRAGLDRTTWDRQPAGDGELSVLPPGRPEQEPVLADDFIRELHRSLATHNHDLRDEARLRLRVAVHHGVAMPADNGYSGQGVVAVSRLVDGAPVKNALALVPDCQLVVVLSERVFSDTVAQRHTTLRPADFRRVIVRNKQFTEPAYLYLPGHDVHAVPLPDEPADPAVTDAAERGDRRTDRTPEAAVINNFHDAVDARRANFGIDNRTR